MASVQESPEQEAAFGNLPVLREERIWKFGDFTTITAALAIASYAFIGGGATALYVGAKQGMAAIFNGLAVGIAHLAWAFETDGPAVVILSEQLEMFLPTHL